MKKHFYTNSGKTLARALSRIVRQYERRVENEEDQEDIRYLLSESLRYFGEMQPFEYRSL